ncbi:MAG: zinc dependent phospholipase C family protein [Polyangia bacterium]
MPAEAIHLSALHDTLTTAPAAARRLLAGAERERAARLGAILVDLPYFDRFTQAVLNYVLKRPQVTSRWGETFHHNTPIAFARALGEAAIELGRSSLTREAGAELLALALGYTSHAAVDTSMHPMVNAEARRRAAALGSTLGQQHHEVEKFQSILFHQERLGLDFMGTSHLYRYISVDVRPVARPGAVQEALRGVLQRLHGEAPTVEELGRWGSGYRRYVLILSSPLGKTIAPPAAKERARPELFDGLEFPRRFAAAVAQSRRWVEAMAGYLCDGRFDDSAREALHRVMPEGSIDPDPGPDPGPPPGRDAAPGTA